MSDGITIYCPSCGELDALKKEYDYLAVKLRLYNLKHQEDIEWYEWYDSSIPVYTCQKCNKRFAIEQVNK